jgi:hypothetical protein
MITVLVKMVQNKSRKKLFKLYRLIARQVGKSALFYFKWFHVFILRFAVIHLFTCDEISFNNSPNTDANQ